MWLIATSAILVAKRQPAVSRLSTEGSRRIREPSRLRRRETRKVAVADAVDN
jgi:hypothetical protein